MPDPRLPIISFETSRFMWKLFGKLIFLKFEIQTIQPKLG